MSYTSPVKGQSLPAVDELTERILYRLSLEVGLRALEEFEGNIIMERKPDGSVDSFRSARNRPRWQYASFIAALCHDIGKVFDLQVQAGDQTWCPLDQPY